MSRSAGDPTSHELGCEFYSHLSLGTWFAISHGTGSPTEAIPSGCQPALHARLALVYNRVPEDVCGLLTPPPTTDTQLLGLSDTC